MRRSSSSTVNFKKRVSAPSHKETFMNHEFIYEALPTRVVFGDGKLAALPDEIQRLGASKALVLSTSAQANWAHQVVDVLGEKCVGIFSEAAMHTPVEVTE